MKFRVRKPGYTKYPRTVTVQQLWIKVAEAMVPIPIAMTQRKLTQGDSLEITLTADELIDAIGTTEGIPYTAEDFEADHD